MVITADTHLFGSRTGYQCLAKSPGVSAAEDRLLSEFGFGQSSDERFLRGLASSPTAFARQIPGGRIAITRVLAGPLDDGGRPTLERRTILLSLRDYLSVRQALAKLLGNQRLWSARDFVSGTAIRFDAPAGARHAPTPRQWRVFDAWVSALDRRPHAVVVGAGDEASEDVLSTAACLADEDAAAFSWGVRLLAPIAWVDVVSLSPHGAIDGRRPVFGLSSAACVNVAVESSRAASPARLPSLAAIRSWGRVVPPSSSAAGAGAPGQGAWERSGGVDRSAVRRTAILAASMVALAILGLAGVWAYGRFRAPARVPMTLAQGAIADRAAADPAAPGPKATPEGPFVDRGVSAEPASPIPQEQAGGAGAGSDDGPLPAPPDSVTPSATDHDDPGNQASPAPEPTSDPPAESSPAAPRMRVRAPDLEGAGTAGADAGGGASPEPAQGFDLNDAQYLSLLETLGWASRICETSIMVFRELGDGDTPAPGSLRELCARSRSLGSDVRTLRLRNANEVDVFRLEAERREVDSRAIDACFRIIDLGAQRSLRNDQLPKGPPCDIPLPGLVDDLVRMVNDPAADRARLVEVLLEVSVQLFVAAQVGGKPDRIEAQSEANKKSLELIGCPPDKVDECHQAVKAAVADIKSLLSHNEYLANAPRWLPGKLSALPKEFGGSLKPADPEFPRKLLQAVLDRALQQESRSDRFSTLVQYVFDCFDTWPRMAGAPPTGLAPGAP